MDVQTQAKKAERLRELHRGPKILVLPNAWDVVSARIVEEAGFPAVATTSAGIAHMLGYPDGQRISRREMLEMVARIASAVKVPVTADLEAGYGKTPEEMAQTTRELIAAGAVGLNLEDITGEDESAHVELSLQVRKIQAVRETGKKLGVPLVINARTDIYLLPIGEESTRFDRTVERLKAYREAGADCVFAPGLKDGEKIGKLVRAVQAPLNILLMQGCPSIAEMEQLGVARVSTGSGLMRAGLGHVRRVTKALRDARDAAALYDGAIPFAEINKMLMS